MGVLKSMGTGNSTTAFILLLTLVINLLLALAIVFLERKKPTSTLAWIMVLFFIPVLGFIFYLFFSQNSAWRKIDRLSPSEEEYIRDSLESQRDAIRSGEYDFSLPETEKWKDLIRLNQVYSNSFLSQDNSIVLLVKGNKNFAQFFDDLERAKSNIYVETFILKPDAVGKKFLEILTRKAAQGVEVKLLLDSVGSRHLRNRHLKKFFTAGGKAKFFFPGKFVRISFNLNYRNHRKLAIIDGRTAYIGGNNIAKEYTGVSKRFGGWRDTNLRMQGGAVVDILNRFVLDWRFASGEELALHEGTVHMPSEEMDCAVQILNSGPDSSSEEIKIAYLKMISSAKKSIRIQTPYFIPNESIMEALRTASMSGVDVSLMIPNQPDHPLVYWVTYANAASLMAYGVKVYIYGKGFLHSKMITVDGEVSSVGSANFDIRSFDLNFESSAVIYSRAFAQKLESAFEDDISDSLFLTQRIFNSRSFWIRFKESVGRLLSEIL